MTRLKTNILKVVLNSCKPFFHNLKKFKKMHGIKIEYYNDIIYKKKVTQEIN